CDASRRRLSAIIENELAALVAGPASADPDPGRSIIRRLTRFARGSAHTAIAEPPPGWEQRRISGWEAKAHAAGDELQRAAYSALANLVTALVIRHGRIWGSHELIVSLATDMAWNDFGSGEIGR